METSASLNSWAESRLAAPTVSASPLATADQHHIATMHWLRDDTTDPASGHMVQGAFARIDDGEGDTIIAHAKCDDSFNNFLLGADESIEFDAFRGNAPLPILWDGQDITTVEYKVDNQDPNTVTAAESTYGNAVVVSVTYRDMSTARYFGVALKLTNGMDPVFNLNPSDPVLRAFTDLCQQRFERDNPSSSD